MKLAMDIEGDGYRLQVSATCPNCQRQSVLIEQMNMGATHATATVKCTVCGHTEAIDTRLQTAADKRGN